jgi:hypothetical protein
MLTRIEGLPAGVIGIEASGSLNADDYRDVLIPMIEDAKTPGGKLRFLFVYGGVDLTAGAAWQDAKTGISNWTAFERIAIVTDEDWIENSIKAFGWIMPGEVKVFDDDDRDDAIAWLSEG